jgi:hypothetical protein
LAESRDIVDRGMSRLIADTRDRRGLVFVRRAVTATDIRMACVLSGAVGNVSEFCQQQQISWQTYYKWR